MADDSRIHKCILELLGQVLCAGEIHLLSELVRVCFARQRICPKTRKDFLHDWFEKDKAKLTFPLIKGHPKRARDRAVESLAQAGQITIQTGWVVAFPRKAVELKLNDPNPIGQFTEHWKGWPHQEDGKICSLPTHHRELVRYHNYFNRSEYEIAEFLITADKIFQSTKNASITDFSRELYLPKETEASGSNLPCAPLARYRSAGKLYLAAAPTGSQGYTANQLEILLKELTKLAHAERRRLRVLMPPLLKPPPTK